MDSKIQALVRYSIGQLPLLGGAGGPRDEQKGVTGQIRSPLRIVREVLV